MPLGGREEKKNKIIILDFFKHAFGKSVIIKWRKKKKGKPNVQTLVLLSSF